MLLGSKNKKTKPIVFVDFDRTICFQRFWRSLPEKENEKVQNFLFKSKENSELIKNWMTGKIFSEEITKIVSEATNIPFERLWEVFVLDCKTMQIEDKILKRIQKLKEKYTLILITINMDSFSRFTKTALDLDFYFDEISNSFEEGILKNEKDGELFLKYIKKHKSDIKKSFLFDDSFLNIDVFNKLGGKGFLVTKEKDFLYQTKKIL